MFWVNNNVPDLQKFPVFVWVKYSTRVSNAVACLAVEDNCLFFWVSVLVCIYNMYNFFNVPQLQGSSVRPGGPWRQGVLCGLDGERGKAACSHNVHSCFFCKSRYSIQTIGILGIKCLRGSFSPSPADAERRRRQQAVHLQILWQPHGRRGVGPPPPPHPRARRTPDVHIRHQPFCTYAKDSGVWLWIIFVLYKASLPALFNTSLLFSSTHTFLLFYPAGNVIDCVPVEQENYKLIFFGPKCLFCIIYWCPGFFMICLLF